MQTTDLWHHALDMAMIKSNEHREATEIIKELSSGKYFCFCPCGCGEEINLKDAGLFFADNFSLRGQAAYDELQNDLRDQRRELKEKIEVLGRKRQETTRSVNFGKIAERLAPMLAPPPLEHRDWRSIFDPIDYIIFEGLERLGRVTKIIFTDIKTGDASLSKRQKEIKTLIDQKKVLFKYF